MRPSLRLGTRRRVPAALVTAIFAALALSALALAHTERPAYWPQSKPDRSVKPSAGGKVPKARTLGSALRRKPAGETRVVCQDNSMKLLRRSVRRARRHGYDIRPHDHRRLSAKRAKRLRKINRRLFRRCEWEQIQPAVTASRNNDRVVIMPGRYREPAARSQPTDDPKCVKHEVPGDPPSRTGAASYLYQWNCPNDQNLIAVMGRRPGKGEVPRPPLWNRHGIPVQGPCIRCNLQIEGSGVSADDVIIEAGRASAGDGGPSAAGHKKDVGVRADRADGFVLRNVKIRHAREHGVYIIETDGYLLDRFKVYYNGDYGVLAFADDHGLAQNCDAVGSGDSGFYPGAPVDTGEQRPPGTKFRYNQELRRCDLHHNLAGFSATNGNAVRVHHNNFYDNALGFNTDGVTAPGHPGFPGDSMLIEHNNFYSNNFNLYDEDSDVEAAFPYPVGTGIWIAGGNSHTIRRNRIWNNWRRGSMVFAVPDQLVCGPLAEGGNEQAGCDANALPPSTSYRNKIYGNVMGLDRKGRRKPNGTDFWWDSFLGTTENCWYENRSFKPITQSPDPLPDCDGGRNPEQSVGLGSLNEAELLVCALPFLTGNLEPEGQGCPWFRMPERPGTEAARLQAKEDRAGLLRGLNAVCEQLGTFAVCERLAQHGP